jgi:CRP/FNR family cyclic AMP-dependent transcriptional regulator
MRRRGGRRSDPKVERLGQVQLFSACSKRELRQIAALVEEVEVPTGRVLMREGDPGREAFVIADGEARVTVRGKRAVTMGPGECFGEMALLHNAPRSATVTAASDMKLFVLGSREFSSLVDEVPSVARKVLAAVADRLRSAERGQPTH